MSTANTRGLDEIIQRRKTEGYTDVSGIEKSDAVFKQAILQWVNDEVIDHDPANRFNCEALRIEQRNILKQHGWKSET